MFPTFRVAFLDKPHICFLRSICYSTGVVNRCLRTVTREGSVYHGPLLSCLLIVFTDHQLPPLPRENFYVVLACEFFKNFLPKQFFLF